METLPADLTQTILECIKKPIKGFEGKENPITETHRQICLIVRDLIKRGKEEDEIIDTITSFQ